MAKPPRIDCLLPMEIPEVYLLTLCQKDRRPLLANHSFATAFETVVKMTNHWEHEAWVIMPDHIHLLASPRLGEYRVSEWSHFVKVMTRRLCPAIQGWQPGVFDHLLRSWDLGQSRWNYLRNNPVRAGLVKKWWEWPYLGGSLKVQAQMAARDRGPTEPFKLHPSVGPRSAGATPRRYRIKKPKEPYPLCHPLTNLLPPSTFH